MKKKVIIINDTRREYPIHLGCYTVMKNLLKGCDENNLEVIACLKDREAYKSKDFLEKIEQSDMLIVNGEGTMHHDQQGAIFLIKAVQLYKSHNKPCVLINSIWQDNIILNDYLYLFDKIYLRDGMSKEQVEVAGHKASVVPDITLQTTVPWIGGARRYKTAIVDSVLSNRYAYLIKLSLKLRAPFFYMGKTEHQKNLDKRWQLKIFNFFYPNKNIETLDLFKDIQLLVTGRFHAMCFAIITETPFMYIPSNTFKIEAMLKDIGLDSEKYNIENYAMKMNKKDIFRFIEPIFKKDLPKIREYIKKSQEQQKKMFKEIYSIESHTTQTPL